MSVLAPYIIAAKELRKYVKDVLKLKASIRSRRTAKRGDIIDIDIDEMNQQQREDFQFEVDLIKRKYQINIINVSERLPF